MRLPCFEATIHLLTATTSLGGESNLELSIEYSIEASIFHSFFSIQSSIRFFQPGSAFRGRTTPYVPSVLDGARALV